MKIQRLIPTVLVGVLAVFVFGATPALAAGPEKPEPLPATSITATTAVLHGVLNPKATGEAGEYQFYYRPSTEACRPGAETFPEPPGTALGKKEEAVEYEITNLEPETTYAFCLIETVHGQSAEGLSLTFKTAALPPAPPVIDSESSSGVTPFVATLEAEVNPNRETTKYEFEYSTKATGETLEAPITTVAGGSTLPPENHELLASAPTGKVLAPGTTYYYRVIAENEQSEIEGKPSEGPVEEFTTLTAEAPFVENEKLTAVNSNEPKLEAKINPNYQETTYELEYATNEAFTENVVVVPGAPPAPNLPATFEQINVGPFGFTGLQPGTAYYYRVVATNATGTTYGDGEAHSFQADAGPAAKTSPAGAPTRTTATVSGTVTPQGLATTYHFAYVLAAQYEAGAANPYARGKETYDTKLTHLNEENHEVSLEDYEPHPVGLNLEELQPETTYVYALVASNELGVTYGAPQTFTTQPRTPALALTGAASGVSQSSATVAGYVDTRGLQTSMQFELGTAPYAGALLPATVVPGTEAGTGEEVQATFGGDLQPGTTYYYRVLASNEDGSQAGAVLSFTTPGFPAQFPTAALPAVVPYTPIAQLDAQEAKEGKAINPGKKKGGAKKKRKRSKKHRRGAKSKQGRKR